MRRSSWLMLISGAAALGIALGAPKPGSVSPAPEMSSEVARVFVERLADAMKARDIRPFLDMAAPDADIFGARPDELRRQPIGSIRMFSVQRREVTWSNLQTSVDKGTAMVSFDLQTVNVEQGEVVRRGPFHVRLLLAKAKVERLWGLSRAEEWRVVMADRAFRRR